MLQSFEVERKIYQSHYHLEGDVRGSGLVDVHVKNVIMPVGDWKEGFILCRSVNKRSTFEGDRAYCH